MKVEIKVPAMGESVLEATVSNIRVPAGTPVARESEILELETDKVNQVVYAPESGQLSLTVKVGDTVKVGQVIGTIDTDVKVEATPAAPAPKPQESGSSRRMATEFVASLSEKKEERQPSQPSNRKKMSSLRRTIASRLVAAKNNTAMLTNFNEVDMSRIIDIRTKEKESFISRHGVKLGFMSFFVKATVAALKAFPDVAAWIDGDDIVYFDNYDIGVAVSTDKGLMVPVVRNCDTSSLADIEKQIEALAKKAREGTISIDDLKGGCFTITNGGIFGSLLSTPILNPPQSGILGMHNILKRPVVVDDAIVIRPMMYLALSYDHRIIDGKEAVLFLGTIKEQLENPHYDL